MYGIYVFDNGTCVTSTRGCLCVCAYRIKKVPGHPASLITSRDRNPSGHIVLFHIEKMTTTNVCVTETYGWDQSGLALLPQKSRFGTWQYGVMLIHECACRCVCIYMYTYISVYAFYMCIYTYLYTCVQTIYTNACIYIYVYMDMCTLIHVISWYFLLPWTDRLGPRQSSVSSM